MRRLLFALAAAAALAPAAATGETASGGERHVICTLRAALIADLQERWGERPVGLGIEQSGQAIELWVSAAGTWTLVATTPTGISCLFAAGTHWETVPGVRPEGGPGDRS